AVWRRPLLGPVAQFRLLLDAFRNARTTRPRSRGGILRISLSTRWHNKVGDVAKSRPQRRASSSIGVVTRRKLSSHRARRPRVTRARGHRSSRAKSRRRRIFPWKIRNRRAQLESRRDREQQ